MTERIELTEDWRKVPHLSGCTLFHAYILSPEEITQLMQDQEKVKRLDERIKYLDDLLKEAFEHGESSYMMGEEDELTTLQKIRDGT